MASVLVSHIAVDLTISVKTMLRWPVGGSMEVACGVRLDVEGFELSLSVEESGLISSVLFRGGLGWARWLG